MSLQVRDLLKLEPFSKVELIGGEGGLTNEVAGVTIIEAPDIVKFINGGEMLLTGLYAFKSCSVEEFSEYVEGFKQKGVSGLVVKRGRKVEYLDEKIDILIQYGNENHVPIFEIPFSVSFRDVLSEIMRQTFDEEITRLKYFRTTYENFAALSFSVHTPESGVEQILETLSQMIGNQVSLFSEDLELLNTTDERIRTLSIDEHAVPYEPEYYSNYTYMRQPAQIEVGEGEVIDCEQYLLLLNIDYYQKLYLVVTTLHGQFSEMDCIAIENAVIALRQELARQQMVEELERKYHDDILNNILNGKIISRQELKRNTELLGIDIDARYRVLVFSLEQEDEAKGDLMEEVRTLGQAIRTHFPCTSIKNDVDSVVAIQQVDEEKERDDYRRELTEAVEKIQSRLIKEYKDVRLLVGIGRSVEGIAHLSDSYKEANASLPFADALGEAVGESKGRLIYFSDMGIFQLLSQSQDPDMLMEYVPESLQKLYAYKKPQRDDLILTLQTYLNNSRNIKKTAQDLFIHYKTAVYRIDRIEKITGIDFDNPHETLSVQIGLIIYKMIENMVH